MKYKYAIILVTYNQLHYTTQCVEALIPTLPEGTQLIVVDNGSEDGTVAWLKDRLSKFEGLDHGIIELKDNAGWCTAINTGLKVSDADYMVLLNNDVLPHGDWIERLASTFERYPNETGDHFAKVGLAGPVSNNVGGPQHIKMDGAYTPNLIPEYYSYCLNNHVGLLDDSGFLSGFCLMISRECYKAVIQGQKEWFKVNEFADLQFNLGGFEDNDTVLIAQEKGFRAIINAEVFMYHFGSVTVRKYCPELYAGLPSEEKFCDKWQPFKEARLNLIAGIRTKNGASKNLKEALDGAAQFCNRIVVLSDGSTDDTVKMCEDHQAVIEVRHYDRPFDERRDRNELWLMARDHGADWYITIDDDEVFCMSRERAEKLMTCQNPHAKAFSFKWFTMWSENHYRDDDTFGEMAGFRMCRMDIGRGIHLGNEIGLHCGNIPQWHEKNCAISDVRVKHLGFDTAVKRQAKFDFYQEIDTDKKKELIGHDDYSHIKDENVMVRQWHEKDGITLNVIMRNEEATIHRVLQFWQSFADEIVVVDTGSTDRSVEIARKFTDKVFTYRFDQGFDLAAARNLAKEKSTMPWIIAIDCDEELHPSDLWAIRRLMNNDGVDGYYFQFKNAHSDGRETFTEGIRMFRNLLHIRWSRPVHETLENSFDGKKNRLKVAAGFIIAHYGFMKPPEVLQAKLDLYEKVTTKFMKKNPDDPQPVYNIAMYHYNYGDFEECKKWLKRCTRLAGPGRFYQAYCQLAEVCQLEALSNLMKAQLILPRDHPWREKVDEQINHLRAITPPPIVIGTRALEIAEKKRLEADRILKEEGRGQ